MSIVYNTFYTVLIGAFALRPPGAVWTDVRDTWWPGMKASVKFWPFIHLITFSPLIPCERRWHKGPCAAAGRAGPACRRLALQCTSYLVAS